MTKARLTKTTQKRAARDERAALKSSGRTRDSYQNFELNLGIGTNNALSGSTYGFNPVTRVRTLLEWIHRGSWLGGVAIDVPAEDMTRAGISIQTDVDPDDVKKLQKALVTTGVWRALYQNVKWSRLYGGSIAVMLIDGQDMTTPLRPETVGLGKFRGMATLDRWMVDPSLNDLVTDFGPDLGLPKFYTVVADSTALSRRKIHHSRVVRMLGIELPFWQRAMENLWGESVLERLYDRLVAFDSATQGAAQLVFKSYIRTYKLNGLRDLIAEGGDSEAALVRYLEMMRKFQGIEGITLLDAKDEFAQHTQTAFTGIGEALLQFAQQISGALQCPLVRLLGQSPAGLNSSGESDLRTYYDGVKQAQEREMRVPVSTILAVAARSTGVELEDEFGFEFNPLWQMTENQKSEVSERDTRSTLDAEERGVIDTPTALRELKQQSIVTNRFTSVTDEMIDAAEASAGEPGDVESVLNELAQIEQPEIPGEEIAKKAAKLATADSLLSGEIGGIQYAVETRAGTRRWSSGPPLQADYGYIRRVGSAEGDEEWMDCFVGKDAKSEHAWVVDMRHLPDGRFEEHKVMLGFGAASDALDAFRAAYGDSDDRRIGGVTHMSLNRLREWLEKGDATRPLRAA